MMREGAWLSRCGLVAALLLPASLASAQPATDPAPVDLADTLFAEATRAMQEGKIAIALEKLRLAWERKKSMDIAANLALLERELGQLADAAQHLDYAIRHFPPTGSRDIRTRMEEDLAAISRDIGRIRVQAPPGTLLWVDGRRHEAAFGEAPVFVVPGAHEIEAKHQELGEATAQVTASAGGEVFVRMKLQKPTAPAPTVVVAPPPAISEPLPMWPGIVGIAVGAAAAGAGIGLLVASESEAAALEGQAGLRCDAGSLTPACEDASDSVATRNVLGNASIGAFVAAGIGAAFGVVWLANRGERRTAIRLSPVVAGAGLGFTLDGAF